jgi:hypothetical protein
MKKNKGEEFFTTKAHKGARRRLKTKKSGALCSFVRLRTAGSMFLRGLYSSSLIRSFSVISLLARFVVKWYYEFNVTKGFYCTKLKEGKFDSSQERR